MHTNPMTIVITLTMVSKRASIEAPFIFVNFLFLNQFFFTTLAGLPAAIELGGIALVTTLSHAMMEPCPIDTPFNIVARSPIHTLSSMLIAALSLCFQCHKSE